MKAVLILTVGGSHQPIVQSIRQNKPDLVHFLCSDDTERGPGSYTQVIGPGNVLSSKVPRPEPPDLPNIVTLTGLDEAQYVVHRIKGLDNLNDCYLAALHLIQQIHADDPGCRVIADYTGGTKSITAGHGCREANSK